MKILRILVSSRKSHSESNKLLKIIIYLSFSTKSGHNEGRTNSNQCLKCKEEAQSTAKLLLCIINNLHVV